MGSLMAEMVVKPTMSLKYKVTKSKPSGSTVQPFLRDSATDLKSRYRYSSEDTSLSSCHTHLLKYNFSKSYFQVNDEEGNVT